MSFTVSARLVMTPPAQLERLRLGALELSKPTVVEKLLRMAAAETLLIAYRKRFLSALPGMVNMQREAGSTPNATISRGVRSRMLAAYVKLDTAHAKGDQAGADAAMGELQQARMDLHGQLQNRSTSQRKFPSGGFRRLALQVLNLMTDTAEMHFEVRPDSVSAGIGFLPDLDAIKTPSATGFLTGHDTTSTHDILWRHLEFGTGAFSSAPQAGGRFRLPGGGWWYGKSLEQSLRLKGSKAGGMLKDPKRHLPYDADSLQFYTVLGQMIGSILGE